MHNCRLGDDDQPPAPASLVVPGVSCTNCQRSFKSAAGLKRHRCGTCPKRPTVAERQQAGGVCACLCGQSCKLGLKRLYRISV